MHAFPHRYRVKGAGRVTGDVELTAERLTMLQSASPAEFDGPGDRWSPETLLVGAVADCFILTFRAIATASRLSWISLDCDVTGTLDRVDRVTQFTHFDITARLVAPAGVDADGARRAARESGTELLDLQLTEGARSPWRSRFEIAEPAELNVPA